MYDYLHLTQKGYTKVKRFFKSILASASFEYTRFKGILLESGISLLEQ